MPVVLPLCRLHCEPLRVSGDILGGPLRVDWRFSKGVLSAFSEVCARPELEYICFTCGSCAARCETCLFLLVALCAALQTGCTCGVTAHEQILH